MSYTITFDNKTDTFIMNGMREDTVGDLLHWISLNERIQHQASSESHLLAILRDKGVEIDLLEEDGSRMVW